MTHPVTKTWVKAEWEYLLWQIGWKKYCQPCDEIFWGWGRRHSVKRGCHCAGLWRL
jgi:hypothetical protein